MPTYQTEIMREARTLARLQAKRRRLRAEVRTVEADIRQSKKAMRALLTAKDLPWNEAGQASATRGTEAGE